LDRRIVKFLFVITARSGCGVATGLVVWAVPVGAGSRLVEDPYSFSVLPGAITPLVFFHNSLDALKVGAIPSDGLVILSRGGLGFFACLLLALFAVGFHLVEHGLECKDTVVILFLDRFPLVFSANFIIFRFGLEHAEVLTITEAALVVL
jgi:hypothetical protein